MQLRDYQKQLAGEAHSLLLSFKIAYLVMEVRTGKTATAFEAARLYGARKVLFVTKLKAISSIQNDFKAVKPGFDLYVINYESLHKCEGGWDLVILDEAHCIGQYPTPAERTKNLKRICAGLPVIFLSGTPSPESYSQFFHQFYVSSFSPWKEYATFYKWHKTYGIPKVKYMYNRQIADYSEVKKQMVLEDVNKYLITYTQEQAGFTSMVEEKVLKIPMSEKVRWAVSKIKKDKIFKLQSGAVVLGDTAVKEMNKVHQLCSGTVKSEDGEGHCFDRSKAEFIKEYFKGKKIAIFYKYVAETGSIYATFGGNYITTDPQEFNRSCDKIFISQIQSGREGINLSTADALVMYNIDYSATSYWQARARLQVKERETPAHVYWIFVEGGIEEKIYEVVQGKKDFTLSHYRRMLS
jgi:superfamily II DNA or RNA helicase